MYSNVTKSAQALSRVAPLLKQRECILRKEGIKPIFVLSSQKSYLTTTKYPRDGLSHSINRPPYKLSNYETDLFYCKNDIFLPILINNRNYSTPQKSNSFARRFLENLKDDPARKEMEKSLEEFQKQMEDYGKTEAVTKAREKYHKIESETVEGTEKAKQQIKRFTEDIKEKAQSNEMFQKAGEMTSTAKEQVQKVGENLSQRGEEIAKTEAFKKVSSTARAVKEEFDTTALPGSGARVYQAPTVLRMRVEHNPEAEQRVIEENTKATGMVLHKSANISSSWNNFKENNKYYNKVVDFKTKLEESDNMMVRATFHFKDKIQEIAVKMVTTSELSDTLSEVLRVDPTFDKDTFLLELEYDIIPNILEATFRPNMKVLKDWTYEGEFNRRKQEREGLNILGHVSNTRVLDIDNVDLVLGQKLPEGPMLMYQFQAQVIHFISDGKGKVVSGSPDSVLRRNYTWALLRNQEDLSHRTAWRLLESVYSENRQML